MTNSFPYITSTSRDLLRGSRSLAAAIVACLGLTSQAQSLGTSQTPGPTGWLLVAAGLILVAICVGVLLCRRQLRRFADLHLRIEARERALRRAKSRFAEIVEDQRLEVESARAAAEAGKRTKKEFLSCVSHELKTPMVGALGYCDLLLLTELTPEQRHYLDRTRSSGQTLVTQIDRLLDFSMIEADRLEVTSTDFDLRLLISSLLTELAPTTQQKALRFSTSIGHVVPRTIQQDPDLLRQALGHLLENAIKFTPSGGIAVIVAPVELAGGKPGLRFAVRDTGVGMRAADLSTVFDPLTQADSSDSRRFDGLGLGLTISQQLIKKLGGALEVTSTLGVGSCFQFEIPFEVVSETTPHVFAKINDSRSSDAADPTLSAYWENEYRLAASKQVGQPPLPFLPEESGGFSQVNL